MCERERGMSLTCLPVNKFVFLKIYIFLCSTDLMKKIEKQDFIAKSIDTLYDFKLKSWKEKGLDRLSHHVFWNFYCQFFFFGYNLWNQWSI